MHEQVNPPVIKADLYVSIDGKDVVIAFSDQKEAGNQHYFKVAKNAEDTTKYDFTLVDDFNPLRYGKVLQDIEVTPAEFSGDRINNTPQLKKIVDAKLELAKAPRSEDGDEGENGDDEDETLQKSDVAPEPPKQRYLCRGGIVFEEDAQGNPHVLGRYVYPKKSLALWSWTDIDSLEYVGDTFVPEHYKKFLSRLDRIPLNPPFSTTIKTANFPVLHAKRAVKQYGTPIEDLKGSYIFYDNGGVAFQLEGLTKQERFWIGMWDAKCIGNFYQLEIDYGDGPGIDIQHASEKSVVKYMLAPLGLKSSEFTISRSNKESNLINKLMGIQEESVIEMIQRRNKAQNPLAAISSDLWNVTPALTERTLVSENARAVVMERKNERGILIEYTKKNGAEIFQVPSYVKYTDKIRENLANVARQKFGEKPVVIYHRNALQLERLKKEYAAQAGIPDEKIDDRIKGVTDYKKFLELSARNGEPSTPATRLKLK